MAGLTVQTRGKKIHPFFDSQNSPIPFFFYFIERFLVS